MKIIKKEEAVTIDAGLAGTLVGDSILIRYVASVFEKEGKNHKFTYDNGVSEVVFDHEFDNLKKI